MLNTAGAAAGVDRMCERRRDDDATGTAKPPARVVWLATGMLSMSLGVIGLALPLLPTTPFLILAAWCFARSSPKLRDKLESSWMFGPSLRDWQRDGAIARRAKLSASAAMSALIVLSIVLGFPGWVVVLQVLAAVGVLAFIWTRPDRRLDG